MTAPSYTEDLTDIATGDEATGWIEFTGTVNGEAYGTQGPPAYQDPDYPFIQGSFSVTQDCTKDASIGSLAATDANAPYTLPTDGAYFVWHNYMVASNVGSYANGGFQVIVGTDATNFAVWFTGGVDKSPYPYGGWANHVANTTVTNDGSVGTLGNHNYVGSAVFVTTGSSKGEVHNVDAVRYGRGSAIFEFGDGTNGYCTFAGFATQNDSNTNRWGLIQATAGGYLWKGRMSIGTATNLADFRDSGKTIFLDWTPKVTANFNLIELLNTSTNLEWTRISIICLDTTTASAGRFLMTAQCSVRLLNCSFVDMDTFVFDKGTGKTVDIDGVSFTRCNTVTQGGADIDGCTFTESTSSTAALVASSTGSLGSNTPNKFVGDGTATPGHAVDFGSVTGGGSAGSPVTINWYNTLDDGSSNTYWGGSTQASTGGTQGDANDAILINVAAGTYVKIAVATGATIPSVQNTGTGFLEITANEVTLTITVRDISTGSVIEGAMVYVTNDTETATYINKVETNASGQVTHTTSLGSPQTLKGNVRAATPATKAYTKYYKSSPVAGTFSNTADTNITIQLIPDE